MAPARLVIDPVIREALETIPCGISVFEPGTGSLLHNETSRQRFPHLYDAFEHLGMTEYADAIAYSVRMSRPGASEEEQAEAIAFYCRSAESGEPYEVRTPDGRRVQVTYAPMSNGRRVAISVDVTELRQRERELKKAREEAVSASNAKSAFLANMSHEIRTPLNGILGMAQVLASGGLTPEQKEQVATILDSGRNLMAVLNDVLDLSKIEAGQFSISPTDTDLFHTMRRLQRLWKPKAEEAGLDFAICLDAELPKVLNFDAVRVRQCMSNLISNAIKFTPDGRVEAFVSARHDGDGRQMVTVRVRDTGIGMDQETLDRLFTPFAQADESTSRKYGGTGLGLSIVRKLAELMGGGATVTSEFGRGSEFSFWFQARQASCTQDTIAGAQMGQAQIPDCARIANQNLRILLVDDHPINRQVARLFLKSYNMQITEATNGREALDCLRSAAFDLVLLDIHMPVLDGVATIGEIRRCGSDWQDIPVIALTADAMSGDRERYLGLGMQGYLSKPLSERDLVAEISRVRGLTGTNAISRAVHAAA